MNYYSPSCGCCCKCDECTGSVPERILLDFSGGFADNVCLKCTGACSWTAAESLGCTTNDVKFELTFAGGSLLTVTATDTVTGEVATWTGTATTADCNTWSAEALSLSTNTWSPDDCSFGTSSVAVTSHGCVPAGCFACRDGLVTDTLQVTVTGVASVSCTNCEQFNGTHLLTNVIPQPTCTGSKVLPFPCSYFGLWPFFVVARFGVHGPGPNTAVFVDLLASGGLGTVARATFVYDSGTTDKIDCLSLNETTVKIYDDWSDHPTFCDMDAAAVTVAAV